ncbi:MAG TPA: SDR family NAD(P)-dependent oxidoreductase [Burkholderiaceae bacterium]|nr:SDR family NAD(P)-dependent oxidoreductase [Burkholderiaceae bacterium]
MASQSRVVMITGAAGNLGRAVAQAFAEGGDRLVLVDLRADALAGAFGTDTPAQLLVAANLLEQEQARHAVQSAVDRFGRLDVLCNLAGGFRMGEAVHETSDATWNFLFDLNARSLLHAVQAAVPRMLELGGGKVINVGAFSAQKGAAQMGAYTASKAVVIRLTEAMAAELRERGINVNCVLPTVIDTPENRRAMPGVDPAKWVAPHDLAGVIRFLASDAARAIHGAAIPVTGLS